jgi:hypothetical protein
MHNRKNSVNRHKLEQVAYNLGYLESTFSGWVPPMESNLSQALLFNDPLRIISEIK